MSGTFKLITFLVFHYLQMRESKVSTGFSSGDYKVHRNGGPKRNEKHGGNSRVGKMA